MPSSTGSKPPSSGTPSFTKRISGFFRACLLYTSLEKSQIDIAPFLRIKLVNTLAEAIVWPEYFRVLAGHFKVRADQLVEFDANSFLPAAPEAIDGAAAAESREPGQGLATVGVIVGSADPNIRIYILQDLCLLYTSRCV